MSVPQVSSGSQPMSQIGVSPANDRSAVSNPNPINAIASATLQGAVLPPAQQGVYIIDSRGMPSYYGSEYARYLQQSAFMMPSMPYVPVPPSSLPNAAYMMPAVGTNATPYVVLSFSKPVASQPLPTAAYLMPTSNNTPIAPIYVPPQPVASQTSSTGAYAMPLNIAAQNFRRIPPRSDLMISVATTSTISVTPNAAPPPPKPTNPPRLQAAQNRASSAESVSSTNPSEKLHSPHPHHASPIIGPPSPMTPSLPSSQQPSSSTCNPHTPISPNRTSELQLIRRQADAARSIKVGADFLQNKNI